MQLPLVQPFQNEHLYRLRSTSMSRHHGRRTPSSPGSRRSWRRTSRSEPLRHFALMTLRVVSPCPALRVISDCAGDTRGLSSPLYRMVCTCTYVSPGERNGGERVGRGGKTERKRERDIRTRRRISGVPLLRSRYDARCRAGFALINDTSVYRAVCLTRIDPVERLPNVASTNTVRKSTLYM